MTVYDDFKTALISASRNFLDPTRFLRVGMITFASALLVFGGVACDDDDDDITGSTTGTAMLRAIHLSPDAPAVEIYLNGTGPAASGLMFPDSTEYLEVASGMYDLAISPAGTSADSAVLTVNGLELGDGGMYTAVAFDSLSNLQALALMDTDEGLDAGDIRVRAIHTATGVGSVDVWNIPMSGDPAILYDNLGFAEVGGYLDLPAGAYTIGFDVNEDAVPDLTFELPSLPAGTMANVFAVNEAGNVYLIAQLDGASTAQITAR